MTLDDAMADADLELVHDACVELAPTLGLDEPTVLAVLRLRGFNAAEEPASILARFRARGLGLDDYVRLLADSVREVGGG